MATILCRLVLYSLLSTHVYIVATSFYLTRTPMASLCGQTTHGVIEPIILSIRYKNGIFYKDDQLTDSCGVHFKTAPNWRLIIIMLHQELLTDSIQNVCNVYLKIRNGQYNDTSAFPGQMCGKTRVLSTDNKYRHISIEGDVLITDTEDAFISFFSGNFKDFDSEILLTPFYSGTCRTQDFRCQNNRCVPYSEYYCNVEYNFCGYSKYTGGKNDCATSSSGIEYLIIALVMSAIFLFVAIAMCCCCYRCRQKRHQRRRRRDERRHRRRLREQISIEMSVGVSNPGAEFTLDVTLPPYAPNYPPPAYSTLPRSQNSPVNDDDDKPPDEEPDNAVASVSRSIDDNSERNQPSASM